MNWFWHSISLGCVHDIVVGGQSCFLVPYEGCTTPIWTFSAPLLLSLVSIELLILCYFCFCTTSLRFYLLLMTIAAPLSSVSQVLITCTKALLKDNQNELGCCFFKKVKGNKPLFYHNSNTSRENFKDSLYIWHSNNSVKGHGNNSVKVTRILSLNKLELLLC